jgi:AcrR family transcriptional regulator
MTSVGLREKKAQRTRERIVHEALVLFGGNGYDETTMEAIAEASEVSASTLFRYFPTKDSIILDPFRAFSERLSDVFSRHAQDHPVEEALAEAIFAALSLEEKGRERALLVRSIVDKSPIPRARLWDYLYEQMHDLELRLAESLRLRADDLRIVLTARLVTTIVGTAADRWRTEGGRGSARAFAEEIMRLFGNHEVILPKPPAQNGRVGIPMGREG